MTSLFRREPETLGDYAPVFDRGQTSLGFHVEKVQVSGGGRGFGVWDEDDKDSLPVYENRYSLTILGLKIHASHHPEYRWDSKTRWQIIPEVINDWLKDKKNEVLNHTQWDFIMKNATDLSNSCRYWAAIDHLAAIELEREKVRDLQARIARAEIIASLKAYEVKQGRWLKDEERQLLLAEFNGGEFT